MPEVMPTIDLWRLVLEASVLVQGVMLILLAASLASWYFIVQRSTLMAAERRAMRAFQSRYQAAADPALLCTDGADGLHAGQGGLPRVFALGYAEYRHLSQYPETPPAVIVEGVQRAMQAAIAREEEELQKHLPFLATVGSVSPYIGLFGTVWGIMHSFLGLSQMQQATLAAVAPGIAEALIATAVGLFAAIPAVVAYNRLAARGDALLGGYQAFADEFATRLHRRVHTPVRS